MADTFHIIVPYSMSKRLGQLYLDALPSITGAGLIYKKPILPSIRQHVEFANAFRLPSRYLGGSTLEQRKSSQHRLIALGKNTFLLGSNFSIVLLGLADDQRYPELEARTDVLSLIGKTTSLIFSVLSREALEWSLLTHSQRMSDLHIRVLLPFSWSNRTASSGRIRPTIHI